MSKKRKHKRDDDDDELEVEAKKKTKKLKRDKGNKGDKREKKEREKKRKDKDKSRDKREKKRKTEAIMSEVTTKSKRKDKLDKKDKDKSKSRSKDKSSRKSKVEPELNLGREDEPVTPTVASTLSGVPHQPHQPPSSKPSPIATTVSPSDAPTSAASNTMRAPPTPPSPTKSLLKRAPSNSSRHKSVSFTSDTKPTDGDSIKQLYLALDPFGKNRTRASVSPPPRGSSSLPSHKKQAEVIAYINTFHKVRSQWRFEKSKQNWLLKNLFVEEAIPQRWDDALEAYVKGLQGEGARDRCVLEAKKVLSESEGDASEKEDKQLAWKTRRARLVMRAMGHVDEDGESDDGTGTETGTDEKDDEAGGSDSSSGSSDEDSDGE